MSPTYVLRYFPVIGLAESSRMLLDAAKVEWIEENPEWPAEKEKQPFGRLPVLIEKSEDESPDFVISESGNIERYLARTYGFLPADLKQAALQEQLHDQVTDVVITLFSWMKAKSDEEKKDRKEKYNAIAARLLKELTRLLKKNGSTGRLFGNNLSYADIVIYASYKAIISDIPTRFPAFADAANLELSPELITLFKTVEADPLVTKRASAVDSLVAAISA
ncbi:hypothetical protein GGF46_002567 [Coemansia sp. RSA 552]|nr:hypothetical protein GGF46_002567 [Coemansia sp. RSA 552]